MTIHCGPAINGETPQTPSAAPWMRGWIVVEGLWFEDRRADVHEQCTVDQHHISVAPLRAPDQLGHLIEARVTSLCTDMKPEDQ
jgi:hypothetical protein